MRYWALFVLCQKWLRTCENNNSVRWWCPQLALDKIFSVKVARSEVELYIQCIFFCFVFWSCCFTAKRLLISCFQKYCVTKVCSLVIEVEPSPLKPEKLLIVQQSVSQELNKMRKLLNSQKGQIDNMLKIKERQLPVVSIYVQHTFSNKCLT